MVTGTEDEKKDENTNRMQLIVSLSFWEAHIFYLKAILWRAYITCSYGIKFVTDISLRIYLCWE